jgi:hypothetical protein
MKTSLVETLFNPSATTTDGKQEVAALLERLKYIVETEPHKSLIDYLYNCLSILDDKSSSLLSFNSIIMAVFAIFMAISDENQRPTALQTGFISVGTVAVLASSFLLLLVVHIDWSDSEDLKDVVEHERTLLRIRRTRTNVYFVARWLAIVAMIGLTAFFVFRAKGW